MAWSTVLSLTLDTESGGQNGYTNRNWFAAASLTVPASAVKVRITFKARVAEGLTITNAYIGHAAAAGDAYDFEAAPTQITFDGGNAGVAIAANNSKLSDEIDFNLQASKNLIIAIYTAGGATVDGYLSISTLGGNGNAYYKLANDAATVDATGYTARAGNIFGVSLIEADVSVPVAGASPIFFA